MCGPAAIRTVCVRRGGYVRRVSAECERINDLNRVVTISFELSVIYD
jgi:hypothetical protein